MTARKPKPKPRKAYVVSMQADDDRIASMADALDAALTALLAQRTETAELKARVEILETRQYLRDKSHDEPVSNAGEAIGQHFSIVGERAPWWRRLIGFMGAP